MSIAHWACKSAWALPRFVIVTPTAAAKEIKRNVAINGVMPFLRRYFG